MSPVGAAVAMLAQNVLAVFPVQAETRNRALLAGLLDCLMWPAGMVTTTITVTSPHGRFGRRQPGPQFTGAPPGLLVGHSLGGGVGVGVVEGGERLVSSDRQLERRA